MSSKEPKKKLVGPWSSLHIVIWMIGIYILATHEWWWPGILVLLAISALYEAFLQRFVPGAFMPEKGIEPVPSGQTTMPPQSAMTPAAPPPPTVSEHRLELLPQMCPNCNAPIRSHEIKWTGLQSANCPYCGTNLPMNKG